MDDNAVRQPLVANRLPVKRIERYRFDVRRHQLFEPVGPMPSHLTIALQGESGAGATQVRLKSASIFNDPEAAIVAARTRPGRQFGAVRHLDLVRQLRDLDPGRRRAELLHVSDPCASRDSKAADDSSHPALMRGIAQGDVALLVGPMWVGAAAAQAV